MNEPSRKNGGAVPHRLGDIMPLSFISNLDEVYYAICQAVYLTADKIGWDILASEAKITAGDLQQCLRDKFQSHPEILKKIYPMIVYKLKDVFEEKVEQKTREAMLQILIQKGLDTREDLQNLIEESIFEYKSSDTVRENEIFAEYLNNIHSLLFDEAE